MATFVRNFHTPYVADGWGCISLLWYYAELLRLAGYTYDSDDGDSAWASGSNVLVDEPGGANGFEVNPNNPLIISDPVGARFTQAMVDDETSIILRATNAANQGAWRMVDFLGATKVRVDYYGRPPASWTPETGIPGRVVVSDGLAPLDGAWILFNAPSPSKLQVRLLKSTSSSCRLYVRPEGQPTTGTGDSIDATATPTMELTDSAGDFHSGMVGRSITISGATNPGNNGTFTITAFTSSAVIEYTNASGVTETSSFTWSVAGDATETAYQTFGRINSDRYRMNMVSDGVNVFLYSYASDEYQDKTLLGELDGVESEDLYPGFWWGSATSESSASDAWRYDGRMLSHVNSQILAHPTFLKSGLDLDDSTQWNVQGGRRLVNENVFVRYPLVVMEDVVDGGYPRGYLPLIGFVSTAFEDFHPLGGAGQWQYLEAGLAVPRNGPNDMLPERVADVG